MSVEDKLRKALAETQPKSQTGIASSVRIEGEGIMPILAGELRAACKGKQSQIAKAFLRSVEGMPDDYTVYVPRLEIKVLLDGGNVTLTLEAAEGINVYRKTYTPPPTGKGKK